MAHNLHTAVYREIGTKYFLCWKEFNLLTEVDKVEIENYF